MRHAALLLALVITFQPSPVSARAGGKLDAALARLLERLDLSDAKKQQIKTTLEAHRADVETLATRETAAREALRSKIERRQPDEAEVSAAADALGEVERDFALERAEIYSELFSILGDDQRVRLLRFVTVTEKQIAAREREAALPLERIASTKKLTDEERAALADLVTASKPPVASAMKSIENARQTLTIAIHQKNPDEGFITKAAESSAAARRKLGLTAARIWPGLLEPLSQKQRDAFRKYTAGLDKGVVERHVALSLFFVDLL